jgi:flagellar basal-body rod protein FlgB
MPSEILTDLTSTALEKGLDGTTVRHRALANNIANIDTPGYQRTDVAFHEQLAAALASTNTDKAQACLERVRPQATVDRTRFARIDGNTTSVETEMGELAKNTLEYEMDTQLLQNKFRMLRAAITDGKK